MSYEARIVRVDVGVAIFGQAIVFTLDIVVVVDRIIVRARELRRLRVYGITAYVIVVVIITWSIERYETVIRRQRSSLGCALVRNRARGGCG